MNKVLLAGIGGFIGSVLRYLVSGWAQQISQISGFPVGTLTVNVIGCLVIGLLGYLADMRSILSPELRLLLIVGVLGGFTTFSTFSSETMNLVQDGQGAMVALNLALHIFLGLGAVWLGRNLAFWVWR